MQVRTLSRLSAFGAATPVTASQIRGLINGIDSILPILVRIPASERFRTIVADDAQDEEGEIGLFSPEAFAAIRSGGSSAFPVGAHDIAIDGRKIRTFLPIWRDITDALDLPRDRRLNPVNEVTTPMDVEGSIDSLVLARSNLKDLIPSGDTPVATSPEKKGSLLGWLLVGAAAVYIKTKVA